VARRESRKSEKMIAEAGLWDLDEQKGKPWRQTDVGGGKPAELLCPRPRIKEGRERGVCWEINPAMSRHYLEAAEGERGPKLREKGSR